MARTLWKMKDPSSGLIREPKAQVLTRRSWCLWWVATQFEGSKGIEALLFSGVEAFKCTYMLAYSAELVTETYDRLIDVGETSFLLEIRSNLKGRTNVNELKHFAISFDDGPLYEFIARGFEFQSPFDVSIIQSNLQQRIDSCTHPMERRD